MKSNKYAALLTKTYEKYRDISIIVVSPKETVQEPTKEDPDKNDQQMPNFPREEKKPKKPVNGEKLKQYKTRKSGERRPFLPEEDKLLLKVLRKTPDEGKLKYKTISKLVKKLNRNDNSIVGRLDQLRSGRHLKMRKCFTLEEDLTLDDY